MTLNHTAFLNVLQGLSELRPRGKTVSEQGLTLAWLTFPERAKAELTPALLGYAAQQLCLDPEPDLDRPLHIQLLRYVYPLRDGVPQLGRGLRHDIEERRRNPQEFHPLTQQAEGLLFGAALAALPEAEPALPWLIETRQVRRARLLRLAQQVGTPVPPGGG